MKKFCFFISALCIIVGLFFLSEGFDKKNNYSNPESEFLGSVNAYVGGDAYNYQINASYFTGYSVLSGSAFVCATIFICAGIFLVYHNEEKNAMLSAINNLNNEKPLEEL